MKVAVVGEESTAIGFMLAGVREVYTDPKAVKNLMERADIAVVFVDSSAMNKLDEKTKKEMEESVKPLFVELEGKEELRHLVKSVLGIEVK